MIQLKYSLFTVLFLLSFICSAQEINPTRLQNLDVNSEYAEIGVKFIQNGKVLFASSKINKIGKKRDRRNNRNLGLRLYIGNILEDGTIINIKSFNTGDSNPIHESNITFTSDFRTIYFTRNNYIIDDFAKNSRKDTIDYQNLKIFKAAINSKGKLSKITPLPINSSNHSVTNPQLSPDNKKLYFISNMKSSFGGFDIYEIDIYSDGTYGAPKNLGNEINSSGNEMFPFVGNDNTLYFSSNGHGGIGNLDVFSISLNRDVVQKITNLGTPINSKEDDFGFVFDKTRGIGYVSSTRNIGVGDSDIYAFHVNDDDELTEEDDSITASIVENKTDTEEKTTLDTLPNTIGTGSTIGIATEEKTTPIVKDSIAQSSINKTEESEDCVQTVEGYILNDKNAILDNATITLYENGQNIGTFDLSDDGKYFFELKCNRHYRITARLNKFEESYFEIRTTRFSGSKTTTNITLDKIPCDGLIAGQIKDLNTDNFIAGVKVYLIQNDVEVDATQTNSSGKYSFQVECDENYKIVTDKFGYEEGIFNAKSLDQGSTVSLNSVLTPIECGQIVRGRINNALTGTPIVSATIELQDEKGIIIESAKSNSNGNYHFNIKCDKNYAIFVSNVKFLDKASIFNSTDVDGQNHRLDFDLSPDICLQTITGTIINSRTKGGMANISVKLLKDNNEIESVLTSNSGRFMFSADCGSNYEVSATTKDYSTNSRTITTNNTHGLIIDASIILRTTLDFEMVRDQLMIITEQIDFDINKSNIREDAAIELNKVVVIMTRNPEIKVDIRVHMDSRAPDQYNLVLSEQQAQSILDFLISRGIASNRLSGKGYGETQLLNKCSNGVPCSETEHLVNRRIEFIVNR